MRHWGESEILKLGKFLKRTTNVEKVLHQQLESSFNIFPFKGSSIGRMMEKTKKCFPHLYAPWESFSSLISPDSPVHA